MSTVAMGLLAAPFAVYAQQAVKTARIGYLGNTNATHHAPSLVAFRQGLRDLGWVEGQNLSIEYRWADGDLGRLPALVADLIKLRVDVIVLSGAAAIQAAMQASSAIPVVAAIMPDPVALGFVASLARPGGNLTGLAVQFEDLVTKQLQLLKETVPKASRVAILLPTTAYPSTVRKPAEAAARALGLAARTIEIRDVSNFDGAFQTARSEGADVVLALPSPTFNRHRVRLAELAAKHRLPAIYENAEYVEDGGLMSYGPNFPDVFRRAANYVDRILKGARPEDMPVEQSDRFELVINLKTAKALGLTIPPSMLLQTTRVIQ
ncbi:MAG: ABC transporter substrate-binding protein [Casimicrobiaceae bacterium]